MKSQIKDYFSFTKSERNGIITLISLILIIIIIPRFYFTARKPVASEVDIQLFKIETETFLNGQYINSDTSQMVKTIKRSKFTEKNKGRFMPKMFDPNTASLRDWMNMGFTEKQSAVILRYRNKGGQFRKKEDFKKLYIIDDKTYRIFEPYIEINDLSSSIQSITPSSSTAGRPSNNNANDNDSKYKHESDKINSYRYVQEQVELNSADSITLLKVRGIGPVFASRILNYKKKLGGFYCINQLTEVYGLDSIRLALMSDQIIVDTMLLTHININTASMLELRSHPYIDYNLAKTIIDKRIQLGGYKTMAELKDDVMRNKPIFDKLKYYISF